MRSGDRTLVGPITVMPSQRFRRQHRAASARDNLPSHTYTFLIKAAGPMTHPHFQPVTENVLADDENVSVRSHMPGMVENLTCFSHGPSSSRVRAYGTRR